ncbi:GntR family transcriptional regulator [Fodinicurvata sp. EGI_FJ10296]|uniref:GntR family transcriptional regulator n=1 Tax=Fodinicurvata sp. EGI_FJ10296 TaxID=3231908 RepID=UPI0034555269
MSGGFFRPDDRDGMRGDGGPLYLRLQSAIARAIGDGRLLPDDALPAERDIARDIGVSRVTVRKAIQALVRDGTLRRRHGSGTFVARTRERVQQPLSRLTSFTEDMISRGLVPTARWLERSVTHAAPEEAMTLGLSPEDRVARLYRLRLANGEPMAIERAVIPARLLPDPETVSASLYEALDRNGARPVRALQRLSAEALDAADADLLGAPDGAAALAIVRISYDGDGRTVEFTRSIYRGDTYDFVAELNLVPNVAREGGQ